MYTYDFDKEDFIIPLYSLSKIREEKYSKTLNYLRSLGLEEKTCLNCMKPVFYHEKDASWMHVWDRWNGDNGYWCYNVISSVNSPAIPLTRKQKAIYEAGFYISYFENGERVLKNIRGVKYLDGITPIKYNPMEDDGINQVKLIPEFVESLKDPKRMQEARACYSKMSYVLSYSLNKPFTYEDLKTTIELVINGSKEQYDLNYIDMAYRFMTPEQRHEFNEAMKKEYNDRYAKIYNIAGIPISELTGFTEEKFPYFKTEKK